MDPVFIKNQQRPWIEFSLEDGHKSSALVHYFSDRYDPFKSVLPQLIAGAGGVEERVFVIESALNEVMDETIAIHCHPGEFIIVDANEDGAAGMDDMS